MSSTTWELKEESELRCEVPPDCRLRVRLVEKKGYAEIFGIEMSSVRDYFFTDENVAIFTWYGCTIETYCDKEGVSMYVSDETPMVAYVNTHAQLEAMRETALKNSQAGPRVMVVGPSDSGKSTLSRVLAAYAARLDRTPMLVDLDVGQGSSVPGAITALPIEKTILSIDDGFGGANPLSYFYGHSSPRENIPYYKNCMRVMAKKVDQRLGRDTDAESSGIIVNTCGWIDNTGQDLIVDAISIFKIDVVLVMSHDRLHAYLTGMVPSTVTVVKLPRSGGVVERIANTRRRYRHTAIHQYFYGASKSGVIETFSPPSVEVKFSDLILLRHGNLELTDALLPLGMQGNSNDNNNQLTLERLVVSEQNKEELMHALVAVMNKPDEGEKDSPDLLNAVVDKDIPVTLLSTNVAGFMSVIDINLETEKITFRSPCPVTRDTLPSRYAIVGSIKYRE